MRSYSLRVVAAAFLLLPLLTARATSKAWTGQASLYWSNPANWNPQSIPAAGEALVFPNGTSGSVNDLPAGTAVGALTFQGDYQGFSGNLLTLMGNVTFESTAYSFNCNAPLKIGAPLTMNSAGNDSFFASIDVNGQTLTVDSATPFYIVSLNGSGTVHANGYGVQVGSNGTFSGTMTGTWDILGSVPNANVNATKLTGTGTVGNVVVSYLRPGRNDPGDPDPHVASTVQTKSLTITGQYGVDLTTTSSDKIIVTGSVTLTGASLTVSLPAGNPPAGVPITIISNDGSDPVVGTFNGLPEGGTLSVDGTLFTISYHGGDGNDVTLTPGVPVKSWVGYSFGSWSNPSSWSPQAIPVPGEPLVFSNGTSNMTNDLPSGFTVGALTFKGGNVNLTGNALTLTGDVKVESLVSSFNCGPVTIGNALTLGAAPQTFYYLIDVNGKTLTVNTTSNSVLGVLKGSGTINIVGDGAQIVSDGTFMGAIHGSVNVGNVSIPNADITAPFVTGNGTVGNLVVSTLRPSLGGGDPSGPGAHSVAVLRTKSLTLAGGSYDVDLDVNPGGASDAVQVNGTVSLSGALNVSLPWTVPFFGQQFLIIDNDGTDKINGTFTNLPEGAAVHAGNVLFRISYIGGDGNDVELTVAEQPALTVSHDKLYTTIGEKATFTASFTAGLPSPLGVLTFAADGSPIGTAPIVNGSATIDTSSLAIGDRLITASFGGGGAFLAAASPPLTHTVRRGGTLTTLAAVDPLVFGSSRFLVTTMVSAPAVTPLAGSVTLRENGIVVGAASLDANGAAAVAAPSLHPGTHLLIASYEGSTTLTPSESRALSVSIAPAETQLVVSQQETPSNVSLTVVASASGVPDLPTGTVTVAENGNTLATEPINGTATVMLRLTAGTHHLTVTYSGDANFLANTVQYDVAIGSAPSSRHRGVRH